MKPPQEVYDQIPPLSMGDYKKGFIHIPGIYCAGCGEVFALYSYSAGAPHGFDGNNKPFLKTCCMCPYRTAEPFPSQTITG